MASIIQSLFGMVCLLSLAWVFSANRRAINWRLVGFGFLLQVVLCLLVHYVPAITAGFSSISMGFVKLLSFAREGATFVFGSDLASPGGKLGFIFAFNVLPIIIFFSAFTALLYHFGILQRIVVVFAWVMKRTMRLTGAESLAVAGNIFLGQTEAPLLVKPFIKNMSRSELMTMMTGGLAHLSGSVLAAYVTFLGGSDPAAQARFASYLLLSSILNAPAAIIFAKMMLPETERENQPDQKFEYDQGHHGHFINAVVQGTADGIKLAVIIAAILVAFVSLIALGNSFLHNVIGEIGGMNDAIKLSTNGAFDGLSLQYLFGEVFRVIAFAIGVDWKESLYVGSLLGQKIVINEFVAYLDLARMQSQHLLSDRSVVIATFALASFANFGSVGICVAGIGSMAPNQQRTLAGIGMRALFAAVLAGLCTACMANIFLYSH
ncbi:NupC/NupG family nucleoside CNT transporter [Parachitinimonas caeni]|uniref:Nucleoside transporter C-terminal domain-containing protein n=1 Tax=Parachitinimonas caeni TaxID=3031301 RepID=A0ABT7DSS4_9NEIS|nr:nucleoside transporter C-terminal domain-containing protein [Parachitinimonas caeni]MDK2123014.1 nucleoside transporter C-terminal domain-containing protein [Parachitinimonas caeni]